MSHIHVVSGNMELDKMNDSIELHERIWIVAKWHEAGSGAYTKTEEVVYTEAFAEELRADGWTVAEYVKAHEL